MDVSRDYQLRQSADALYQLADIVEDCGLNAGDLGRMLCHAYEHASFELTAEARRELFELRNSRTGAAQFAAGLRRQADRLQARAAAEVATR